MQIPRWRHQMETFSALLAICAGNSPVPGEFLAQRPVTRSFDVSLICVWINGWVNNRDAGDLRRYRAHYDVTAVYSYVFFTWSIEQSDNQRKSIKTIHNKFVHQVWSELDQWFTFLVR